MKVMDVLGVVGQAASRILNAVRYGGSVDQSTSARAYVEGFTDPAWARRRRLIDAVFRFAPAAFSGGKEHCRRAWDYEVDSALETLARNGLIPKD